MSNKYYKEHAEEIKERQRKLYQNDKEFRKIQIQRVADYKRRKRAEKKLQKQELKLNRKIWRKIRINNVVVECCRITYLASALGRKSKRIREWELAGNIGKGIRVKNMRYYTKEHFNMVTSAWNKFGNGKDLPGFFNYIMDKWDECFPK